MFIAFVPSWRCGLTRDELHVAVLRETDRMSHAKGVQYYARTFDAPEPRRMPRSYADEAERVEA